MNNEVLLKQLIRQMRIMNFTILFFGGLFLAAIAVAGFMLWQLVMFIGETNQKLESLKTSTTDSLNVKKQTCEANNTFSTWLQQNTQACE